MKCLRGLVVILDGPKYLSSEGNPRLHLVQPSEVAETEK